VNTVNEAEFERRWLLSGFEEDRMAHRRCCRQTNHLITDSRRSHISYQLNDCTDSRQRWRDVREHSTKAKPVGSLVDNDALCVSCSTFLCNKMSSLTSVIASQITSLPSPPSDPICRVMTDGVRRW